MIHTITISTMRHSEMRQRDNRQTNKKNKNKSDSVKRQNSFVRTKLKQAFKTNLFAFLSLSFSLLLFLSVPFDCILLHSFFADFSRCCCPFSPPFAPCFHSFSYDFGINSMVSDVCVVAPWIAVPCRHKISTLNNLVCDNILYSNAFNGNKRFSFFFSSSSILLLICAVRMENNK